MKYVIVIEDGASDYPIAEIDGKTPLKIANKPVLLIVNIGACVLFNKSSKEYIP